MKNFRRYVPLIIRRVRGVSMAPTLADGDFVVILRSTLLTRQCVGIGHLVLLEPSAERESASAIWRSISTTSMVKRITGGDAVRGYAIAGDNPSSMESHNFGNIKSVDVVGRVVLRIPKTGSVSFIRRQAPDSFTQVSR